MSIIEHIVGREVLDSRGNPTVEVEVVLDSGAAGRAIVPSGASTGQFEAVELRDGGDRYGGKGVLDAVAHVNGEIADALVGFDALDQRDVDRALIDLDGTDNKARLGANAILGVSLAVAKAAADELELPLYRYVGGANAHVLPVPMMNVLNGGVHADNNVDFQEFMIMPVGAASLPRGAALGRRDLPRAQEGPARARACPPRSATRAASPRTWPPTRRPCSCWSRPSSRPASPPGDDIAIALDPASHRVLSTTAPTCSPARAARSAPAEMADYWADLCDRYPIVSIEDGMAEEDWDGWARAHRRRSATGSSSSATTCSSPTRERLGPGHRRPAWPTRSSSRSTRSARSPRRSTPSAWPPAAATRAVMSHRSGETEDATIADLAVATNCGQIKTGAPARSDRVAKYNQLLRIEEELGEAAAYRGTPARPAPGAERASSARRRAAPDRGRVVVLVVLGALAGRLLPGPPDPGPAAGHRRGAGPLDGLEADIAACRAGSTRWSSPRRSSAWPGDKLDLVEPGQESVPGDLPPSGAVPCPGAGPSCCPPAEPAAAEPTATLRARPEVGRGPSRRSPR